MKDPPANGKFITFYSYKGGTGRSMMLANVAWILASQGRRVLMLDWDLEAPGLYRYFQPFLADKNLASSDGLIDFVIKYVTAAKTPSDETTAGSKAFEKEWYAPYANILRYASSLDWKFDNGGTLDLIPAGRQGPSYSTRVNSFNWQNFYDHLQGGVLLELAKEKMRAEYDYILIDSRTGVSDTSGICTVQMPDVLVVCFTLNNQSIAGASDVATAVLAQRTKFGSDGPNPPDKQKELQIFPVPMRIENAEKHKLQKRKDYAREKFRLFPNSLPVEERDQYWGDVPVIYIPYYAYEEILAPFSDNSKDRISILAAAEQLTSYLTEKKIRKLVPPPEAERQRILAEYEGGPTLLDAIESENRFAEFALNAFSVTDQELARRLFGRLVRVTSSGELGGHTLLRVPLSDVEPATAMIVPRLVHLTLIKKEYDPELGEDVIQLNGTTLPDNWIRLKDWLEEDKEFLLWRQQLKNKIAEWEKTSRDSSALLSGTLLTEAERWLEKRVDELNRNEAWFIKRSSRLKKPGLTLPLIGTLPRRSAYAVLISALLLVVSFSVLLWRSPSQNVEIQIFDVSHDRWIISGDNTTAISFTSGEASYVWRVGTQWTDRKLIERHFDNLQISSHGAFMAGTTSLGEVFVWKADQTLSADSRPALKLGPSNARLIGFSPDEKWVFAESENGRLYLWRPLTALSDNPQPYFATRENGSITLIAFSPKGTYLVITDWEHGLILGRLDQPSTNGAPPAPTEYRNFGPKEQSWLYFSADERWLAVSWSGYLYVGELASFFGASGVDRKPEKVGDLSGHYLVDFSPDGNWCVARGSGVGVFVWPTSSPPGKISDSQVISYPNPAGLEDFGLLQFSADSKWVTNASAYNGTYVWRVESRNNLKPVIPRRNTSYVDSPNASFSPRGDLIAADSPDGGVFVWKPGEAPNLFNPIARHEGSNIALTWCDDSKSLFVFGGSEVFFGDTANPLTSVIRSRSVVQAIMLTPDAKELVVFGERHLSFVKKRLKLWGIPLKTYGWPTIYSGQ
jgi:MinD-like ATPase involved in chromosome partitioning or flagellar assembly/WD40 repeat protein